MTSGICKPFTEHETAKSIAKALLRLDKEDSLTNIVEVLNFRTLPGS